MRGKVCLVTGANAGIGKATALGLAKLGATVVMICRDQSRGESALAEIKERSGNSAVNLLLADLSSQDSIRRLTSEALARYPQIHVLVNNAGVWLSKRTLTVDGIEATFAINHLAPFLLTDLLLERLKASAPARIITVSASIATAIDFDDLGREKHYSMVDVYRQSKLANMLFTQELATRLEGTGVTTNCLHPGMINTGLARDLPIPIQLASRLFFASPTTGAQTSIYLASSPAVDGISGKYFTKKRMAKPPSCANDAASGQRLWRISEEMTRVGQTAASASMAR